MKKLRSNFKSYIIITMVSLFMFFSFYFFIIFSFRAYKRRHFVNNALILRSAIINDPELSRIVGINIKTLFNFPFLIKGNHKLIVVLTLHSLDCLDCLKESIFLNKLSKKYQ